LSGITGRAEIMESPTPGGLGGTFGGNPVSCAAGVAVFEQIERDGLLEKAKRIEQVLGGSLRDLASKHECIAEVRGLGAMIAIEIVKPGTLDPDTELVNRVIARAQQQGVLLLSAGLYGNVIRFLPSLQLTDALIE